MAGKTYVYTGTEAGVLYRKEASEDHWHELMGNGLLPEPAVRAIVVHPDNPSKVYIGTQRGVYLSDDNGDHWKRADLPEGRVVWSIAFQPDNPQIMYLGTEGNELHRSDDGGETWKYMSTIIVPEAVQMQFSTRILGLSIERNNPNNIYAALEVGGAARSLDGGKTWKVVNQQFAGDVDLMDLHAVAVGSPEYNTAFISNRTGIWRTKDKGETWENTHVEKFSPIIYSRGVRVAPNDPNTVYACIGMNFGSEEGGVMRSLDGGDTWARFDRGVEPKSTTFGVAINPKDADQVYFCTRKGQVFGTHDGGSTWKEHRLPDDAKDVISVACASG